jgi:hypothetical protein
LTVKRFQAIQQFRFAVIFIIKRQKPALDGVNGTPAFLKILGQAADVTPGPCFR